MLSFALSSRRNELPAETALLLGEPSTMGYEALQNELGFLIHGETWATETLPKILAKTGAHLQNQMEIVIPDSIDKGEKPFIKPFMVDLADDHYELDISRARKLLDWEPKHSLRDALPAIIKELKADPLSWYKRNKLTPAEWIETMAAQSEPADQFLEAYNRSMRDERRQNLWAHFLNMGMGTWLMTSPPILGYQDQAMIINDMISGALVFLLAALSLSRTMAWARIANAVVGLWLLFAPLVFWTPSASAYLNNTLVGSLVIGFAILDAPHSRRRSYGKHDRPRYPARMGLQPVIVDAAHTDHFSGFHRALYLPLSCRLSIGPYRERLGSLFRRWYRNDHHVRCIKGMARSRRRPRRCDLCAGDTHRHHRRP